MNKNIRKGLLSLLMAFVILAAGAAFYKQTSEQKKSVIAANPPAKLVRTVETQRLKPEKVANKIAVDGRLSAFEKIDLSAEVQGVLKSTSKPFKEGTYFKKGDMLFAIDNEYARLNLLAQRSNLMNAVTLIMPDLKLDYPEAFGKWKKYLDEFDVEQSVKTLPEVNTEQEKYFISGRNIYSLYYTIKSLEAQLVKYRIYAPFNGVVTRANIFTGQLVNPGVMLGSIMNTNRYELSAPINMADLKYINVGQKVILHSEELGKNWKGEVSRISRVIDPVTQNLPVYISVYGKDLRDGMYLKGELEAGAMHAVIPIAKDLLVDRNHVFVVKDSLLQKKVVEIIRRDEQYAYIIGVAPDEEVVTGTLTGLYEGQKVIAQFKKQ